MSGAKASGHAVLDQFISECERVLRETEAVVPLPSTMADAAPRASSTLPAAAAFLKSISLESYLQDRQRDENGGRPAEARTHRCPALASCARSVRVAPTGSALRWSSEAQCVCEPLALFFGG